MEREHPGFTALGAARRPPQLPYLLPDIQGLLGDGGERTEDRVKSGQQQQAAGPTHPLHLTVLCSVMKSQLTFTPEVLTCCTLHIHCGYYLTLLVVYERLNILNINLALNIHVLL